MALTVQTPLKTDSRPPAGGAPAYSRSPHCCTASLAEIESLLLCCTAVMASGVNCWNIMLVEKGADVAAGQSSRNGGAVHVGINYSPSSQKNYFNYRGNVMYSRLSKELDFPFERTGHLMLIGAKWEKILPNLLVMNSKRLHIPGVRYLNREQLLKIEPYAPS